MKNQVPILCITGSDSMSSAGIQSDIVTVRDLGAYAVTAVTSIAAIVAQGTGTIHELSTELIIGQIKAIFDEAKPKAVKIGMVNGTETIKELGRILKACKNIVCAPGILSSKGMQMMDADSINAMIRHIFPITKILSLKCNEAEIVLKTNIRTDDDMVCAAKKLNDMGAEWVLLRGGTHIEGKVNALLWGEKHQEFFSSYNVEGWKKHGIGGIMSTAMSTRLALGDNVTLAVKNAHHYLHNKVIYAVEEDTLNIRQQQLYNSFLSLVIENYKRSHNVAYYAQEMAITTRYLTKVTNTVVQKTPKQIIDEYLILQTEQLLSNTAMSIKQIAEELGFSSPIILARFFRDKKQCSLSQFRQLNKKIKNNGKTEEKSTRYH